MTEQALYENGSTFISNARAVIAGTTFAISGISSVRTTVQTKRNYWPAILLFLASALIGGSTNRPAIWGGGIIVALILFIAIRPVRTYHVITTTQGREFGMLSTTDSEEAQRIVKALNEAIIAQSR